MVGDSCSEGHGFDSQHCILNGHFSHTFVVKIVMFEKTKINKKRPGIFAQILLLLFLVGLDPGQGDQMAILLLHYLAIFLRIDF